jgi:hypothetical protein
MLVVLIWSSLPRATRGGGFRHGGALRRGLRVIIGRRCLPFIRGEAVTVPTHIANTNIFFTKIISNKSYLNKLSLNFI